MLRPELLRNLYLLRQAAPEDIAALGAASGQQRYGAGRTIFHEGEKAGAMYLVELGTVEILTSGDGTVITTIGSGGEFGELAFFDGGRRSATARTREASEVIAVPYEALRRILSERPGLAQIFYQNACAFLTKCLRQTSTDLSFSRDLNRRRL